MDLTRSRILIVDNHDSFVYNLKHLIERACDTVCDIDIVLNDEIDFNRLSNYGHVVISPGPGIPSEAGSILPLIKEFAPKMPILGICLGHQAIAEAFGGRIHAMDSPLHGVKSQVDIVDSSQLFSGLGKEIWCGRYHSWAVDGSTLPKELKITAVDSEGCIMAMSHRRYNVHGLQFHPESFLTDCGEQIVRNFLKS